MRRGLIVSGLVVAMLVILAPAALAKGNGEALVSGPGLRTAIVYKGRPTQSSMGQFWEFVSNSGLFEENKNVEAPNVALGPRYAVTVFLSTDEQHPWRPINRARADRYLGDLYPYAVGGPWLYVPANQDGKLFGPIESGWWAAPGYFLDDLMTRGLPTTSPVSFSTEPPGTSNVTAVAAGDVRHLPPPGGGSELSRLWVGLGAGLALMLMLIAGTVAGRPRRARITA